MSEVKRLRATPKEVAEKLVATTYREAQAVFLAGSVVRGDATATSDIDLLVVGSFADTPSRHTTIMDGWLVETCVMTAEQCRNALARDVTVRRPLQLQMCAEGILVSDDGETGRALQRTARRLLAKGPPALSPSEVEALRYLITDLVDDLVGSSEPGEWLFIAAELINPLVDLRLASAGRWRGRGKWVHAELAGDDLGPDLERALSALLDDRDKTPLLAVAESALASVGGRLTGGFRQLLPEPPRGKKG